MVMESIGKQLLLIASTGQLGMERRTLFQPFLTLCLSEIQSDVHTQPKLPFCKYHEYVVHKNVLSILLNLLFPTAEIQPQHIMDSPPCFTVALTQRRSNRSPSLLQQQPFFLSPNKSIFVSSVKNIFSDFFFFIFKIFFANLYLFLTLTNRRRGLLTATQPRRPHRVNILLLVILETAHLQPVLNSAVNCGTVFRPF